MSLTDPIVITIVALVVGMLFVGFWIYQRNKQKRLSKMEEITQSDITAIALPKTNSDETFVIKEGDRDKMQPDTEYAYFYGSRDNEKSQSLRYHSLTVFSLKKLQKPVLKSINDEGVIARLESEGWRKTGSQSFGVDDIIYYFQRSAT